MAYIGKSPTRGVRQRYIYTATGSETSISASDTAKEATGKALSFTDGAYVDVYKNGALLEPNEAYNTNTTNTIAGLSSLSANDVIEVIVFDIFTTADAVSAVDGGTFSGAVTFDSDATFTGANYNVLWDKSANTLLFYDNSVLKFGSSADFHIKHNATDTSMINYNGDLLIQNSADDKDIVLINDNGSGGVSDWVKLDGSTGELDLTAPGAVDINASSGNISLDASTGNISLTQDTGNMVFTNTATNSDFTFTANGTGALNITGGLKVGVDDTGHDVKFFGATSGKYMEWDESADQLDVTGSLDVTGNTSMVGTLTVGVDDTGHDVIFYGADSGSYLQWDESVDELILHDTALIRYKNDSGTNTLSLYHSGDTTYLSNEVGSFNIFQNADDQAVRIYGDDGSGGSALYFQAICSTGDTKLYHYGNEKISTKSTGIDVTGVMTASGRLITDDTTEATTTTDGSLQTDGGLSVAKDAVFGDDVMLLSDSAVLKFGADSDVTLTHAADTSLTCNLMMAATTFEPSGDTAAGDNAAIGYTASEGLILTGQGSTSDITIKNDADADVLSIATGTTILTVSDDVNVVGRATGTVTTDNDGNFDLQVSNQWICTPSGNFTLTLSNPAVGQSGSIMLINSGGHTVSAHASIAINATTLTSLTTAGTYMLSYYCSAASGNNTILVSASGALT